MGHLLDPLELRKGMLLQEAILEPGGELVLVWMRSGDEAELDKLLEKGSSGKVEAVLHLLYVSWPRNTPSCTLTIRWHCLPRMLAGLGGSQERPYLMH